MSKVKKRPGKDGVTVKPKQPTQAPKNPQPKQEKPKTE